MVKRNADVLLQLLQSGESFHLPYRACQTIVVDEPEEVEVVKSALLEHLEMDPRGTLGVLCDQLTSVDSDMDEDERTMRERLRYLVSAFLTDEALQPIVRLSRTDPSLEAEFLSSLFGVRAVCLRLCCSLISAGYPPSELPRGRTDRRQTGPRPALP